MLSYYKVIYKINLEGNTVKMMGPYYPSEPLTCLINQLKKGQEFSRSGGQMIANSMMALKGITLLVQTATFNKDIRQWRRQYSELKTWASFKTFFHRAHWQQIRALTTTGKGGYTVTIQNLYDVLPPPPEDHNEAVDFLNRIVKGMQNQSEEMEGLAQANAVLTSSNSAVMAQLEQITATMNAT